MEQCVDIWPRSDVDFCIPSCPFFFLFLGGRKQSPAPCAPHHSPCHPSHTLCCPLSPLRDTSHNLKTSGGGERNKKAPLASFSLSSLLFFFFFSPCPHASHASFPLSQEAGGGGRTGTGQALFARLPPNLLILKPLLPAHDMMMTVTLCDSGGGGVEGWETGRQVSGGRGWWPGNILLLFLNFLCSSSIPILHSIHMYVSSSSLQTPVCSSPNSFPPFLQGKFGGG